MIDAMKTLSVRYPRYGDRRSRVFLRRRATRWASPRASAVAPGWPATAAPTTTPAHCHRPATPLPAVNANFVWAYDFVFDATADGRRSANQVRDGG